MEGDGPGWCRYILSPFLLKKPEILVMRMIFINNKKPLKYFPD